MCLGYHRGGNQWGQYGTEPVEAMQDAQDLACVRHVPQVRIPRAFRESVTEPGKHEGDNEHWVRGVCRDDYVRCQVARGACATHAAFAHFAVQIVIQQCRGCVAHKR